MVITPCYPSSPQGTSQVGNSEVGSAGSSVVLPWRNPQAPKATPSRWTPSSPRTPFPSPGLTLQLIDATVIHAVSRFPLQLLQVLLILTGRASVKVLHHLIKLPQQVTELISHRWGQEVSGGKGLGQAPGRQPQQKPLGSSTGLGRGQTQAPGPLSAGRLPALALYSKFRADIASQRPPPPRAPSTSSSLDSSAILPAHPTSEQGPNPVRAGPKQARALVLNPASSSAFGGVMAGLNRGPGPR